MTFHARIDQSLVFQIGMLWNGLREQGRQKASNEGIPSSSCVNDSGLLGWHLDRRHTLSIDCAAMSALSNYYHELWIPLAQSMD